MPSNLVLGTCSSESLLCPAVLCCASTATVAVAAAADTAAATAAVVTACSKNRPGRNCGGG